MSEHRGSVSRAAGTESATDSSSTSTRDVPHPDSSAKPDSPADISQPSWRFVARKTYREFLKDECTDIAAALTYYGVLAMFPAIIALLSLVGLFGQGPQTVDAFLQILRDIGAGSVAATLEPVLASLSTASGAGFALIGGLLVSLWSASGYVNSFSRAMNRIYEIEEGRPIWKLRPAMLGVTLVMLLLTAVVAIALVLTGPAAEAVGRALGLGSTVVTVWSIVKWPVLLGMVVVVVAILYWATPNIEQPKFRWVSLGALLAIVVWIIASAAFGLYVANFSSYNETYGSLAGVIVFLLWLWITNLALLFGAELDAELERGRELQAGIAAEEQVQLPARDTTKIEKTEKKQQEDVERARRLRLTRGESQPPQDEQEDD